VVRGPTGQVLCAAADRPDDLLIVGAGRRGSFARLVHGRVSRFVLGHALCPVLAVPWVSPLTGQARDLRRLGRVGPAGIS
jgi:nucleotide-binding universal stress UspA family protein